jgi:hypothetical protein
MKFIAIIFALITTVAAADDENNLRVSGMKTEAAVSARTATINCPSGSWISQTNANIGGVLDRVNFRCNNNPIFSSFG